MCLDTKGFAEYLKIKHKGWLLIAKMAKFKKHKNMEIQGFKRTTAIYISVCDDTRESFIILLDLKNLEKEKLFAFGKTLGKLWEFSHQSLWFAYAICNSEGQIVILKVHISLLYYDP